MILLICLITIIFILSALCIYIFYKYKKQNSDFDIIIQTFHKLRYGDVNLKIDNMKNKKLEASLNRLIETIRDREMMIREYQSTLSDKNLSLEELIRQEKQLQQFKEEFAATLTHDMKVPVIAELNSIDYLLNERFGNINDKQREVLNLMKNSNNELKELIENMLETYKLEQKEVKLNLKKHNFNSFLNSIMEEMLPIALNSEHKITNNLVKTEDMVLEFDALQLKRVIKNLIQNAISFSPNGSNIKVQSEKLKSHLKLNISNKGNNLSKEDIDLIFNKYYSGSSKYRKAGTGLGLYLAKQIILLHKGDIRVDNTKEDETVFELTLPL